jgi:transposase-like protein
MIEHIMNHYPSEVLAMPAFPRSILEFQRQFPDESACAAWLSAERWPEGFRCPCCGHDQSWMLATKAWTRECTKCHRQTSVTAGTVMHGSKLPLTVWFWAAYLMATHSNGLSARQMGRQLGLGSYKSAWLLCAKLRRAMVNPARALLSGTVEIDETQISHRTKDDPVAGGGGRSPHGKMQIIAAVEVVAQAPGRLRLGVIKDASAASLHPFIKANVIPGAILKTDGWSAYPGVAGFSHQPHVVGTMAAHIVLPWVHRVFSNLKTWALGVYHGLRRKHLQAYLDEFVFRFNRRRSPHAAFRAILNIATVIPPVTYNRLIAQDAQG